MTVSVLLLVGLAGCTGLLSMFSPVPAAGLEYLKSLPKGALQQANPQDVRVAINLPVGVEVARPSADITMEHKDAKVSANLSFQKVPQSMALAEAPAKGSGNWTYYALTQDGKAGFKKIQAFMSRLPPFDKLKGHVTLIIKLHNQLRMEDCARNGNVPLKAAIMLDPKRGYVTIWDHSVSLSELAKPKDRLCPPASG